MRRCRGITSLGTILFGFTRAERRVSPSQERFASGSVENSSASLACYRGGVRSDRCGMYE